LDDERKRQVTALALKERKDNYKKAKLLEKEEAVRLTGIELQENNDFVQNLRELNALPDGEEEEEEEEEEEDNDAADQPADEEDMEADDAIFDELLKSVE